MEINVNTASRAEMLEYARTELGLKVEDSATKSELKDLVAKQLGDVVLATNSMDSLMDEMTPEVRRMLGELRKEKKVKIRIFENKDHPSRIPVGVNGVMFTIKPGAVVEVPESVVGVLENAITTTYSQVYDDRGEPKTIARRQRTFDFERIAA